jgi:hypothetical protein
LIPRTEKKKEVKKSGNNRTYAYKGTRRWLVISVKMMNPEDNGLSPKWTISVLTNASLKVKDMKTFQTSKNSEFL